MKIVILDDSLTIRMLIESFLEDMMGHRVGVYVQGDRTIEVVFHLGKRSQLDDLLAKLNSIPR